MKNWTFQIDPDMGKMDRHGKEWLMVKVVYSDDPVCRQKTYISPLCAG